jgi:two-component system, LytTR family, response regulator LytT
MTSSADDSSSFFGLRALVVEDEWVAREFLVKLIEGSGVAWVVGAVGNLEDATEFLQHAAVETGADVVFVDVNLVGSADSGLALIRRFAAASNAPAFVLATAVKDHALEAFELGAVDYLLKPFTQDRVLRCLERVAARRPHSRSLVSGRSEPSRIVARSKRNLVFLDLAEVWAFESSDRLTLVHAARGSFDIDLSLAAVEQSFGRRFLRVHRSWLVNERYIQELERDSGDSALLVGGVEGKRLRVPVARDRAHALRTQLIDDGLGIRRR